MSRAYSADLRERVLAAVAAGQSARGAAARFGIGPATASRWVCLEETFHGQFWICSGNAGGMSAADKFAVRCWGSWIGPRVSV